MMVRHGWKGYPAWVDETVDKRLLALHRIPESAYNRLFAEEQANKEAFERLTEEASAVLHEQDIPAEIRDAFRFHDANVLSIKKKGTDVEMFLRDGGFMETPYCRVIFRNVSLFEREKGLVIRTKREDSGEIGSNVIYLYEELYCTESGYEVHMMLTGRRNLRYLTVGCVGIEVQTCELE